MEWSNKTLETVVKIIGKHEQLTSAIEELNESFDDLTYDALRKAFQRNGYGAPTKYLLKNPKEKENSELDKLISVIKNKKNIALSELCDKLDCGPSRVDKLVKKATSLGYRIVVEDDLLHVNKQNTIDLSYEKIPVPKTGTTTLVRFGVISDTHYGSKAALTDHIAHFVERAYDEFNVRTIFHAGDITTGNSVYNGQVAELSYWGCQAQCEEAAKGLPQKKGLTYYTILGNHDIDFIKKAGIDPGLVLQSLRPDIKVVGQLKKTLVLEGNGLSVELIHIKSNAHARSYALEKHVAKNVSKKTCPDIVLAGHLHTNGFFEVNGIQCFLLPCFEDANYFVKYHDFFPSIGGLVIDVHLNSDGEIVMCVPHYIKYNQKMESIITV